MRFVLLAAAAALFAAPARAADPAVGQACVVAGSGFARVAARVANPADCCTGRLQCAQFLSTTTVVRPVHDNRT